MNFVKTNNVIINAADTAEEIQNLNSKISSISMDGIRVNTKMGATVTEHLDDKTKDIIANIVLPELEAKREELTEYLQTLLTGGIINDESK